MKGIDMNRRLPGLAVAIALALLGTALLVSYVGSAEDRALKGERLAEVLVVKDQVPAGTKAEDVAKAVKLEKVPVKVRAESALRDLASVKGKVTSTGLLPGEQVVADRFVDKQHMGRGLVPAGLQEVTVPLDPARALGGRIEPGQTVGIVASFGGDGDDGVTHLIQHKVLVTGVQSGEELPDAVEEPNKPTSAPSSTLLISLAGDAGTIERIVFAAEHGSIWLTAEPVDAPEAGSGIVTKGSVLR
jgi:pilus assembly protein CpaB